MKKIAILIAASLALVGCAPQETVVRLATHDSFYMTDEQLASFTAQTGFELEIIKLGDTGSLTNQLVLSKNAPIADAVYGIDNTFEKVATDNKITDKLTAINYGDVCFNYDIKWFEDSGITPPDSWRQLGDEKYRGLTVVTNPILSSPGFAFLATTYAGFETNAEVFAYWRSLRDNAVKVASDWTAAYFSDFTRYGGNRPIVLSYASSLAAEIDESGEPLTAALLDECFRQTEYAAVLTGAKNQAGAKAVVEFLLSEEVQRDLPWNMFVYPVLDLPLPEGWPAFAVPARSTIGQDIDFSNRERLLKDWGDVFDN
jgi:thiamine transport system substrate-binding protein